MDEDEQDELVASLEKEGNQQIQFMNKMFTAVCFMAMGITVLLVAFHGGGLRQFTHALYSAGVHWLARTHAMVSSGALQSSNTFVLLILLVLAPLYILASFTTSMNEDGTSTLHWCIALANLLVAICSILLRMESVSTIQSLEQLQGSKYQYKSL